MPKVVFDFEARSRFYDRKSSTGASWRSALKQIFYCFRFLSAQQKPFCASFPSINRRSERFRLLVKDTRASYGLTNIVLPRFSPHETLLIKVMLNVLSWMTRRMLLISFVSPSFPRPVTWVSRWKEAAAAEKIHKDMTCRGAREFFCCHGDRKGPSFSPRLDVSSTYNVPILGGL